MTYQQGPGGYGSPYGDPRHGQVEPYGQPSPYPPPVAYPVPVYGYAYPPKAPTNTMAILSLVFAFVFALLGLIFGIVAKKQIKESGEGGDGLATAGIIVSAAFMAVYLIPLLIWLFFIIIYAIIAAGAS